MDRNSVCPKKIGRLLVALRKESVDRNKRAEPSGQAQSLVALRKESVDRNWCCLGTRVSETLSLSARRAWIEIPGKFV